MVSLRPIDDTNREAVEALRVTPAQELFVSGVGESLQEAVDEPDGRALYWAVYADDTPVGFVMSATTSAPPATSRTTSGSCSSTRASSDAATAPRR